MHTLPDYFIPNYDTACVLAHVHEGVTIPHDLTGVARNSQRARLLDFDTGPSARSGYLLTANGLEALYRYVEANTSWRRDTIDGEVVE